MNAQTRQALDAAHHRRTGAGIPTRGACAECGESYPCTVRLLLDDLRELQHAVFHALDDSEDRGSEGHLIDAENVENLCKLVPDEHP